MKKYHVALLIIISCILTPTHPFGWWGSSTPTTEPSTSVPETPTPTPAPQPSYFSRFTSLFSSKPAEPETPQQPTLATLTAATKASIAKMKNLVIPKLEKEIKKNQANTRNNSLPALLKNQTIVYRFTKFTTDYQQQIERLSESSPLLVLNNEKIEQIWHTTLQEHGLPKLPLYVTWDYDQKTPATTQLDCTILNAAVFPFEWAEGISTEQAEPLDHAYREALRAQAAAIAQELVTTIKNDIESTRSALQNSKNKMLINRFNKFIEWYGPEIEKLSETSPLIVVKNNRLKNIWLSILSVHDVPTEPLYITWDNSTDPQLTLTLADHTALNAAVFPFDFGQTPDGQDDENLIEEELDREYLEALHAQAINKAKRIKQLKHAKLHIHKQGYVSMITSPLFSGVNNAYNYLTQSAFLPGITTQIHKDIVNMRDVIVPQLQEAIEKKQAEPNNKGLLTVVKNQALIEKFKKFLTTYAMELENLGPTLPLIPVKNKKLQDIWHTVLLEHQLTEEPLYIRWEYTEKDPWLASTVSNYTMINGATFPFDYGQGEDAKSNAPLDQKYLQALHAQAIKKKEGHSGAKILATTGIGLGALAAICYSDRLVGAGKDALLATDMGKAATQATWGAVEKVGLAPVLTSPVVTKAAGLAASMGWKTAFALQLTGLNKVTDPINKVLNPASIVTGKIAEGAIAAVPALGTVRDKYTKYRQRQQSGQAVKESSIASRQEEPVPSDED